MLIEWQLLTTSRSMPSAWRSPVFNPFASTIRRAEISSPFDNVILCRSGMVAAISTSPDRQRITLSNGEEISARLLVLANGLNTGLRQALGMDREVVSSCHSISIGFDLKPVGRQSFDFRALTYYPERSTDRMAYLSLFPIGSTTRANLFVYRDMQDPWLRKLRAAPLQTLFDLMPGLKKLTGDVEVTGFIKIRPVDLYLT